MTTVVLHVYVDPRKRGLSLAASLKPALTLHKNVDVQLAGQLRKSDSYGNCYHVVTLFSECDIGFEYLQAVHEQLRKNVRVTHYSIERFYHQFLTDGYGRRL